MACGTGGFAGPLPGDPGNAFGLTATPAFGGIQLVWRYPALNPHAVAHTIVYKSTLEDFQTAIEYRTVSGGEYFDRIDVEQGLGPYSYWVQSISINGTPGALLGPATATARPTIDQTIRDLTGLIDAGFLAQSLRTEIERVELLDTNLAQEILDRLASNEAFADLLGNLQGDLGAAQTLIQQIQTQRAADNVAQVNSLNLIAAALNGNIAALATEQTVRATADTALATSVSSAVAASSGNTAAIAAETTARTDADTALATQITEVQAETVGFSAALAAEATARATADSAMATQITTIQATLTGLDNADLTEAQALVATETAARVAADSALASQITTAQTAAAGNLASAQTTLQTQITTNAAGVTALGALWTAKVNVNGLLGGFGIYNNGTEVEAGFDVDRFWVGRTSLDKKKPFIIEGGEVFIDKAVIGMLNADNIDTRGLDIRDASGNVIFAAGGNLNFYQRFGAYTTALPSTDIVLVQRVGTYHAIAGNTVRAPAGGGFSGAVTSIQRYLGGCACTFRFENAASYFIAGLTSQPNGGITLEDYSFIQRGDNLLSVRVGGLAEIAIGANNANNLLGIEYDGSMVKWTINGVVVHSVTAVAGKSLYFCASVVDALYSIKDITFVPYGNPSAVQPSNPINSGNVSTYIANAALGNAQIGGDLWSTNYVPNFAGWIIKRNGDAEFNNVKVRGDVQATSLNGVVVNTGNVAPGAITNVVGERTSAVTPSIVFNVRTTIQTVTLNSSGGTVILFGGGSYLMLNNNQFNHDRTVELHLVLQRNGVDIVVFPAAFQDAGAGKRTMGIITLPPIIDNPGAGTIVYTLQAFGANSAGTIGTITTTMRERVLVAQELKR